MGGRCYAEAGNQFDHYTVEYTFADGTKLFAFARHMSGCWNTYSDYAHGTKGSAVIMETWAIPSRVSTRAIPWRSGDLIWEYGQRDNNPYVEEWQLLLDAIRNDTPHNEARRAGEANLAALMGRAATHTGAYLTWDQMLNSDFQFVENIDALTFDSPAPLDPGRTGRHLRPAHAWNHQGSVSRCAFGTPAASAVTLTRTLESTAGIGVLRRSQNSRVCGRSATYFAKRF
jgi:hypothetical protein